MSLPLIDARAYLDCGCIDVCITSPLNTEVDHIPGFTHIISTSSPAVEGNTYTRTLLASGNGYPMWIPTSNLSLPSEYLAKGTSIGDVGILDRYGLFTFHFNIFLPSNHPCHTHGMPRNFVPLEPFSASDVRRSPNYFPPGSTIRSSGIQLTRSSYE